MIDRDDAIVLTIVFAVVLFGYCVLGHAAAVYFEVDKVVAASFKK